MPPEPTLAIPERSSVETTKYVTGVLRQFTSNDFKKEVVEASKTLPVVFQFYSDT
jgi:thioredoxin-like negative regulator of GroEL